MAEMKSLNGYEIVDERARERLDVLEETGVKVESADYAERAGVADTVTYIGGYTSTVTNTNKSYVFMSPTETTWYQATIVYKYVTSGKIYYYTKQILLAIALQDAESVIDDTTTIKASYNSSMERWEITTDNEDYELIRVYVTALSSE